MFIFWENRIGDKEQSQIHHHENLAHTKRATEIKKPIKLVPLIIPKEKNSNDPQLDN